MDKLLIFRSFVTIVDEESLKGAANTLNLSPSAISKHLSLLESAYNTSLISRSGKKLNLTPYGREFYKKCKDILNQVEHAEQFLEQKNGVPKGSVSVTIPQILGDGKLISAFKKFSQQYPSINLKIITQNTNIHILDENIDFAFRGGHLTDSQLKSIYLFQSKSSLFSTSDLLKTLDKENMIKEIERHLIIPSYLNLYDFKLFLKKIGLTKRFELYPTVDDAFVYKNLVLSGQGLGIFLECFFEKEISENKIIKIERPAPFDFRTMKFHMLFHPKTVLSRPQLVFKDFIKDYFIRESYNVQKMV